MLPQYIAPIVAFIFGSVIGSFLNVCIYRLPRGQSIVSPGSYCFSCGADIAWYDNIPVLSYLWLRGRCRNCRHSFSGQYPLVELLTALLFAYAIWSRHVTALGLMTIVAGCCLIPIFFIDLRHYIIPDEFVLVLLGAGIVADLAGLAGGEPVLSFTERYGLGMGTVYIPRSLLGAMAGIGLFYLLAWVFGAVFKKESLGEGDIKLAGAVGAWLGPGYAFLSFFLLAVFSGALIGLILMALGRKKRREYIPFGPMLAASALALILWQNQIVPWVLKLYGGGAL